jgi:hypothetical protein
MEAFQNRFYGPGFMTGFMPVKPGLNPDLVSKTSAFHHKIYDEGMDDNWLFHASHVTIESKEEAFIA